MVRRDKTCKHCRACNKCTPQFDHHCKWLNTCIGGKNYRPFFIFLCNLNFILFFEFGIKVYLFVMYFVNRELLQSQSMGWKMSDLTVK